MMPRTHQVFMCQCSVQCIAAYCPEMISEATVVTHFMFGSSFVQNLLKFITLILCLTKLDYVVKIWAILSLVHKHAMIPLHKNLNELIFNNILFILLYTN